MPAAPARAPPIKKAMAMTRSTLIPIMAAASRSCATARMALPSRVERTNQMQGSQHGHGDAKQKEIFGGQQDTGCSARAPAWQD